jgi:hypothetical protein
MIKTILIPSDPKVFKRLLLKTKQAERIITYKDGSVKHEMWNARKFTPSSNLMGNISSQLWHRADRDDIAEAEYRILEFNLRDEREAEMWDELYIKFRSGWSSFVPQDRYVYGYVIENDTIEISYNAFFSPDGTKRKKLSARDMRELISILDDAAWIGAFGGANTEIIGAQGPAFSYDYDYRGRSGVRCRELITNDAIMHRYRAFIDRITK